jgi:hypothetical protein
MLTCSATCSQDTAADARAQARWGVFLARDGGWRVLEQAPEQEWFGCLEGKEKRRRISPTPFGESVQSFN